MKFAALLLASSLAFAGVSHAASSVPGSLGFEYQRLNNCGPVTAKMTLSLYGVRLTQATVADALKGARTDRNVTTVEMAAYFERFGLNTVRRWALTPALTRRLIDAGFPVVLHQTQTPKDDIGHFRLAHAFDGKNIYSGDSMFGPRTRHNDADFQKMSAPYGGEFLIAYRPNQTRALERALGADWNRTSNLRRLETNSRNAIKRNPRDAYAWWSLGQALLYSGSSRAAAPAFREAARIGLPKKHFWYQQDAFDAWNRVGWYSLTREYASAALRAYRTSAELNLALARALTGLKRQREANAAWRAVLGEAPDNREARAALARQN
jgi:hypothetical protein